MRISLDPWTSHLAQHQTPIEGAVQVVDSTIEQALWLACPAQPIPLSLEQVWVIDGTRRIEAQVLLSDDDEQTQAYGAFGSYAVGAVCLDPHGRRTASSQVQVERVLAVGAGLQLPDCILLPETPEQGILSYRCLSGRDNTPETPQQLIQAAMLRAEQQLSARLALGTLDIQSTQELPCLVLQDGPLRLAGQQGYSDEDERLMVGYVKTFHARYLPPQQEALLNHLAVGERTPIFHFAYQHGVQARFSWYLRLAAAQAYQPSSSGVIRLEMYAPSQPDGIPAGVQQVANWSGSLMCLLASQAHKDPRAPQNLIPTGALERELRRQLGQTSLLSRRIRRYVLQTDLTPD